MEGVHSEGGRAAEAAREERGLLVRQAHESNADALRLSLTPAGRTVVRQATAAARDVDVLFFGPEPAPLRDALRRIVERADGSPAPPAAPWIRTSPAPAARPGRSRSTGRGGRAA